MKNLTKKINDGFFRDGADKVTMEDTLNVVSRRDDILGKLGGALAEFMADVKDMLAMVRDYCSGDYREIPFRIIAGVVFTLLYILSPLDLIPDFIPIAGLLDDAAVIGICLKMLSADIEKYRRWKAENGADSLV